MIDANARDRSRTPQSGVLAVLLVCLQSLPMTGSLAAVTLDPEFWDSYQPFWQYSHTTIRDLTALNEGDLLQTARKIDGLELRLIGRRSPYDPLISARIVVDSTAMRRLQVKYIPFEFPPTGRPWPQSVRRPITADEAETLERLLEKWDFWDAPYSLEGRTAADEDAAGCENAGHWIIEAVKPGSYEIMSRSSCGGLDPAAAEIRDFLIDLAGAPPSAAD
jgi:hypothetical protein